MPKNKAKKGKGRGYKNGLLEQLQGGETASNSQEEETLSEASAQTSNSEHNFDETLVPDENGEVLALEEIEAKLKESIDGLTEKNAKYRQTCLRNITASFSSTWLVEFLENYRETLLDGLEKCLRKGKGEEQAVAAELLSTISIQLGNSADGEDLFQHFKPILSQISLDDSRHSSVVARTKCCQVLGVVAFMACDDMMEVLNCMETLVQIFKGSYLKGDKSVPVLHPLVSNMHQHALSSWALLLSITPWEKVKEFAKTHLPKLPELLSSSNVAMRITAGETIALFYEILHSENHEEMAHKLVRRAVLVEDLKELATDSNKHRAKKDRRLQRSSFRDILRTIQNAEPPEDQIKFGSEILYLCSWTSKRQYTSLRDCLNTGMNFHLKENVLLREIFQLGPVLLDGDSGKGRNSHFERHLYNQAAFKARSQIRGRQRDKRSGFA